MIDPTSVFWLGAFGMGVGTVVFVWSGVTGFGTDARYTAVLAAISSIAMVAYVTMGLEIGWVSVDDRIVFVPRYVDWILTTPLLLVFLGMLAGSNQRELALVVSVNTVVMVGGFVGALLTGPLRFGLFALATVAYAIMLYLILGSMSERARRRENGVNSLFTSLRNLTVVLWSVYPLVWLLGPPGIDALTIQVDVMLITYLDLLTKVGFGLIAINASTIIHGESGSEIVGEVSRSG
ncbi:bacteriorhodopsin [Natrarchaeobius oligotrophus]|uniref:Sensory rhodopsin-2 n=1 Tax=Natrarchaeobius chitinivorans TaxID=1679083 RepID=A0A3N6MC49_NATCH|nr:bacteriorhodopsin [Natrarchaeobius chitinivorans]RQH01389.1 sensory rhodopsin-2 [Natrarchaeobius chitinivorans]